MTIIGFMAQDHLFADFLSASASQRFSFPFPSIA